MMHKCTGVVSEAVPVSGNCNSVQYKAVLCTVYSRLCTMYSSLYTVYSSVVYTTLHIVEYYSACPASAVIAGGCLGKSSDKTLSPRHRSAVTGHRGTKSICTFEWGRVATTSTIVQQ